jgi:error-prone DNA polymerase
MKRKKQLRPFLTKKILLWRPVADRHFNSKAHSILHLSSFETDAIEDELGCVNIVIFENLFHQYRKEILNVTVLLVEGSLQVEGEVIHVVATKCYDVSKLLRSFTKTNDEQQSLLTVARADKKPDPLPPNKNKKESAQQDLFSNARNFR